MLQTSPTMKSDVLVTQIRNMLDQQDGASDQLLTSLEKHPGSVAKLVEIFYNYDPPSMEDQMTGFAESLESYRERNGRLSDFISTLEEHQQLGSVTKAAVKVSEK